MFFFQNWPYLFFDLAAFWFCIASVAKLSFAALYNMKQTWRRSEDLRRCDSDTSFFKTYFAFLSPFLFLNVFQRFFARVFAKASFLCLNCENSKQA